jgi:hypothetical protein
MRSLYLRPLLFFFSLVVLLLENSAFAQFGSRQQKRAFLKTRNKQISRFTVRTDFSKSKKYISFGGGAGMSNYFGDLAPNNTRTSTNMQYTRSYLTAYYLQRVHPNVTIRGALSWMRLRGDDFSVSNATSPDFSDYGRFIRNLSFRNNIFELSGVGIFELFPTDRGYLRRTFVNPYFLMGLSVFTHNPSTRSPVGKPGDPKSTWVNLRDLGTEGQYTGVPGTPRAYSLLQIGVPLGFGIRYRLMDKFDLSLELGYRFVFTDYLDDVSGRYPSDEVYQQMYQQENYLGIALSNRSAETIAAIETENRAAALNSISKAFSARKDPTSNASPRDKVINGLNPKNFSYFVQLYEDSSYNTNQNLNKSLYRPNPEYLPTSDLYYFRRVRGNEYGAAPRGNKRRDYWLITALHLSYILEIKQKPPKFR